MRLWSIHPGYLDAAGLVALWREGLLALRVLEGNTRGYQNHPQLIRFKAMADPVNTLNYYLSEVFQEASRRHYRFDHNKIDWNFRITTLQVTRGQMEYEVTHLLRKLQARNLQRYELLRGISDYKTHPLFKLVEGPVEAWEVQKNYCL